MELRGTLPGSGRVLVQALSGPWLLALDPENRGREDAWFGHPAEGAQPAPVPGIIQQVYPDCHGVAWYWLRFTPAHAAGPNERCLLRFGAVDYLAEVWLNGTPVGGHEGGETPFTLDVTGALRPGGENLLAVRVLNPTDEPIDGVRLDDTPHRNKYVARYQPGMSYNYGGILLPVNLAVVPAVRVDDVFLRADPATGRLRAGITLRNDTGAALEGRLTLAVGPDRTGEVTDDAAAPVTIPAGESAHELEVCVAGARLWNLDDPFLYRALVGVETKAPDGESIRHLRQARCGFRDLRVEGGFFRLNGKRIFLRSTHTGNHFPIGQVVPPNPDLMRRDLLYAKASGYNTVRFIAGVAWPEQLDCCDEIGLMVYEESLAGWLLGEGPHMADRFDLSVREMVLRDRNHPSVTIWGMLNETKDGPVFRHAVEALSLVRELDDTRLVLLNSGRWDCQPGIGSVSNPGSREWQHEWGTEAPVAPAVSNQWDGLHGGYFEQAGDAHVYPPTPHPPETLAFLRSLGHDTKPVFLSEYGIGSLFNAIRELRTYEQAGAGTDLADVKRIRSMAERLESDWKRLGMENAYPSAEAMLHDSQRLHARQRLLGFDLVRSNPRICGFNLTGMLDHALTGEGLWTYWREFKPECFDALRDGWAPLRWCLFADPMHGYTERPLTLEAVLANEDVLPPGEYPVRLSVSCRGTALWQHETVARIPKAGPGEDPPLAVPVFKGQVALKPDMSGELLFAAEMLHGGSPAGGRLTFHRSGPARPAPLLQRAPVTLWGMPDPVAQWLAGHAATCRDFAAGPSGRPEILLVGTPTGAGEAEWADLERRVRAGSWAILLSPDALREGDDPLRWLPLEPKGRCDAFHDWLYHKECVAAPGFLLDQMPGPGIMDWDYYGPIIPRRMYQGQATPDETAAAAFAVGYCCPGGYASGVLVGGYQLGEGMLWLNTLRILESFGTHPASEQMLANFIHYAAKWTGRLPAEQLHQ